MTKVILKENVPGQGKTHDIVDVSEGFARNFLIPRGKAVIATPEAIMKIEQEKKKLDANKASLEQKNKTLKNQLETIEILLTKKAKQGKLFGSVTNKEVTEKIKEKGFNIEPKQVIFYEHIKSIGEYKIGISLDKNTAAVITLKVEEER